MTPTGMAHVSALEADEGKGREMTTFGRSVAVFAIGLAFAVAGMALLGDGLALRDLHESSPGDATVASSRVELVGHGHRLGLPWLPVDRLETVRYAERTWAVPKTKERATIGEVRTVLHREGELRSARYAASTRPGVAGRFIITGLSSLVLGGAAALIGFVRAGRARTDEHDWSTHHNWRIDPPYPDRHGAHPGQRRNRLSLWGLHQTPSGVGHTDPDQLRHHGTAYLHDVRDRRG